jgi:hypothetical protein
LALVLGGLTIFNGVGFFIIAVAVGLLWAWWSSRGQASVWGPARGIAVSVWLLLSFGGALAGLWLRDTPACWDSDVNVWVASDTANECSSDLIDDTEGGLALAGVVVGFAGLALLTRRGRESRSSVAGPAPSLLPPITRQSPADRAHVAGGKDVARTRAPLPVAATAWRRTVSLDFVPIHLRAWTIV